MRAAILAALLIVSVAPLSSAHGQGPTREIPPELILERFSVSKDGDALLVPVRVAENNLLFLADTGAAITWLDTSVPLGQPVGAYAAYGTEGNAEVKLYHPPDASIGRVSLGPLQSVAAMDLNSLRESFGHDIRGLLGMDFLGKHVVHIDVENGELLLLKEAPKGSGIEVPITWVPGNHPVIQAELPPGKPTRFVVDTGSVTTLNSGSIGPLEVRFLVGMGQAREVGRVRYVSISGADYRPLFQTCDLAIGTFTVRSPVFRESRGRWPIVLGLGFWSRFAATFDFPGRKVYLRKSARFGHRDRWNATGVHLLKRGGLIEIVAVEPASPGLQAGLKSGDVLVEIDGRNAAKLSLFAVRSALCGGGRLPCVVRRGSGEVRLSIDRPREGQ
jgi:hypothetical protein